MKKSLILVSALIVLAVLVGCNADQISGFGKGMEKIGDLGLGQRRTEPMNAAVENVKAYIETSEKCFNWPADMKYDTPKDESVTAVTFAEPDGEKQLMNTISYTIDILLNAKESSANSKELRSALNAKYSGVTKKAKIERNNYKVFKRCPSDITQLLANIVIDPDGHLNPGFAKEQLKMLGLSDSTIDGLVSFVLWDLPMPISTYDIYFIFKFIGEIDKIQDLMNVYRTISSSGGGGSGRKLDLSALKVFMEDITASVGTRDYETVGDKLTFNILYYLIYSLSEVNQKYKETETYKQLDDNHKYAAFFEYVLENPEGFEFFDRFLNGLQAIGYIYDVKLDVTGLVSNAI